MKKLATIEACCAPLLVGAARDDRGRRAGGGVQGARRPGPAPAALADRGRARGTACSCDLEEPVGKSQPTVSHHLSVLADAGLITKEKVGRWVNCTVVPERLARSATSSAPERPCEVCAPAS